MHNLSLHRHALRPFRLWVLALCLCAAGNTAQAQRFLNPLLQFAEKKQPIFGLDNRRTHVRGKWGVIYGVYSGIGMGKHLRLKNGISASPFGLGAVDPALPQSRISRLGFLTLGEEVDFFHHGKFTWTSYLQGGLGYDYFEWLDPDHNLLDTGREAIFRSKSACKPVTRLTPGWQPKRAAAGAGYFRTTGTNSVAFFSNSA